MPANTREADTIADLFPPGRQPTPRVSAWLARLLKSDGERQAQADRQDGDKPDSVSRN